MTLTLRNGYTSVFGRIDWNWIESRLVRDVIIPEDYPDDVETYWEKERHDRYLEWWRTDGITIFRNSFKVMFPSNISGLIELFNLYISEEEFHTTKEGYGSTIDPFIVQYDRIFAVNPIFEWLEANVLGELDDTHRPIVLSSMLEFMNERWLTSLIFLGIKFGMGVFREEDSLGNATNTPLLLKFFDGFTSINGYSTTAGRLNLRENNSTERRNMSPILPSPSSLIEGYLIDGSVSATGTTTINIKTGTDRIHEGQRFMIEGVAEMFTVTALDGSGTSTTSAMNVTELTFNPTLSESVDDGAEITFLPVVKSFDVGSHLWMEVHFKDAGVGGNPVDETLHAGTDDEIVLPTMRRIGRVHNNGIARLDEEITVSDSYGFELRRSDHQMATSMMDSIPSVIGAGQEDNLSMYDLLMECAVYINDSSFEPHTILCSRYSIALEEAVPSSHHSVIYSLSENGDGDLEMTPVTDKVPVAPSPSFLVNGASQSGTSLNIDGGSATFSIGQKFTIDGIRGEYTITNTNSPPTSIQFTPALISAPDDDAVIHTYVDEDVQYTTRMIALNHDIFSQTNESNPYDNRLLESARNVRLHAAIHSVHGKVWSIDLDDENEPQFTFVWTNYFGFAWVTSDSIQDSDEPSKPREAIPMNRLGQEINFLQLVPALPNGFQINRDQFWETDPQLTKQNAASRGRWERADSDDVRSGWGQDVLDHQGDDGAFVGPGGITWHWGAGRAGDGVHGMIGKNTTTSTGAHFNVGVKFYNAFHSGNNNGTNRSLESVVMYVDPESPNHACCIHCQAGTLRRITGEKATSSGGIASRHCKDDVTACTAGTSTPCVNCRFNASSRYAGTYNTIGIETTAFGTNGYDEENDEYSIYFASTVPGGLNQNHAIHTGSHFMDILTHHWKPSRVSSWTGEQLTMCMYLGKRLIDVFNGIKPRNHHGHYDLTPTRKYDPVGFPFARMLRAIHPEQVIPDVWSEFWALEPREAALRKLGYPLENDLEGNELSRRWQGEGVQSVGSVSKGKYTHWLEQFKSDRNMLKSGCAGDHVSIREDHFWCTFTCWEVHDARLAGWNRDDDGEVGVTISPLIPSVSVGATVEACKVRLGRSPTDSGITVKFRSSDETKATISTDHDSDGTFDSDLLIFTPDNWNQEQSVKVTGVSTVSSVQIEVQSITSDKHTVYPKDQNYDHNYNTHSSNEGFNIEVS